MENKIIMIKQALRLRAEMGKIKFYLSKLHKNDIQGVIIQREKMKETKKLYDATLGMGISEKDVDDYRNPDSLLKIKKSKHRANRKKKNQFNRMVENALIEMKEGL